jgi:hypothetical protein
MVLKVIQGGRQLFDRRERENQQNGHARQQLLIAALASHQAERVFISTSRHHQAAFLPHVASVLTKTQTPRQVSFSERGVSPYSHLPPDKWAGAGSIPRAIC